MASFFCRSLRKRNVLWVTNTRYTSILLLLWRTTHNKINSSTNTCFHAKDTILPHQSRCGSFIVASLLASVWLTVLTMSDFLDGVDEVALWSPLLCSVSNYLCWWGLRFCTNSERCTEPYFHIHNLELLMGLTNVYEGWLFRLGLVR